MGMRSLWDELIHSRAFWVGYIAAGVDFEGCPSLQADERQQWDWEETNCEATLTFTLPKSYLLRLEVDLGEHRLQLVHPTLAEPMLIGTMDCHQMSDLFRWDEF